MARQTRVRKLRRAARNPLIVAIELCGRNGLRPSEARGLRWECIDLENQTLTINRQMSSTGRLTKPKNKRSYRTIPFDDLTAEYLINWRANQQRKRARAGDLWGRRRRTGDHHSLRHRHQPQQPGPDAHRRVRRLRRQANRSLRPTPHRRHLPARRRPRAVASSRLGRNVRTHDR
ncbi:MAG: tyrosine-type recombinase/integrase [Acidimicrobiales bacterium]